ncbi:fibronectin type III domain-containing protein [Tumebacillus sp. DT12]|uniref:Fibronectin type III domain-containing protein n=1 Tax=Tumebacillus lacus TaxID=2995335 RepID=A0ABT3X2W5_9BACL|nr:fibronectin type III domain-containing protein [Tumebacillus lacus]MCX7570312.1 fibronectin type III domain-containing protein [Tumebacillus lacus]
MYKRMLSLLCCLALMFSLCAIQAPSASATPPTTGGLLRNVLPDEGYVNSAFTDGLDNTTSSLGSVGYAKWNLGSPRTITGFYFKAMTYAKLEFLDASGNVLKSLQGIEVPASTDFIPLKLNNVAAIRISGNYSIHEVDVSDTFVDQPPAVPTGTAVYPYDGKQYIGWNANQESTSDIAGYNVYQDGVKLNSEVVPVPHFVVSGLVNGQDHTYQVTAVDLAGQESGKTAVITSASRLLPGSPIIEYGGGVNEVDKDLETFTEIRTTSYAIYNIGNNKKEVHVYFAAINDIPSSSDRNGKMLVYFQSSTGTLIKSYDLATVGTNVSKVVLPVPVNAVKVRVSNKSYTASRLHEIVSVNNGPLAPTHLVAVAGDRKANLSWDANTEPNIVGYNVYMDGVKINTSLVNGTTYSVLGLTNGVTYSFTVTAVDADGNESPHSNVAYATPKDSWPPDVPQRVVTTGLDGQVDVKWDANTDSDLAGYNLYQDGVKVNGALITDAFYSVTGLTNGTTYVYTVTAVDTSGNESEASSPAPETPRDLTAPAAPAGLTATAGNGSVTLAWSANGETDLAGYYIWQDGVKINSTPITDTSFVVTGLTNGWSYTFAISAVDAAGNQSKRSVEAVVSPSNSL